MRATRQGRPVAGCVVLAACLAVGLGACSSSGGGPTGTTTPVGVRDPRPNIVLIQTDDQITDQFTRRVMPRTFKLLVDRGTDFSDYIVTTSECCPSRASLLTGQYAHNHGVGSNQEGYPGLKDKHDVLPVWLRRAGYRTIHVGAKYLNHYPATKPAPGWTNWFTVLSHTQYYDYRASNNGHKRDRGHRQRDYITRVLGRKSERLIKKYAADDRPFYLQLDERAPHVTKTDDPFGGCNRLPLPDPRDERAFAHDKLPDSGSFNEADMSDKPSFLRSIPSLGEHFRQHLRSKWRCALESMVGVDRNVAGLVRAVKRAGALDRTIFIYVSDNGLFYGEHRIVKGKVFPYEESIRLPFAMRVPKRYRDDARRVPKIGQLVANIDLAPTILDLAHAKPCARDRCRTMDGRSLMPLLTGKGDWPANRAVLNEYKLPDLPHYSTCKFAAVRTRSEIYVEHYRVVNADASGCKRTLEKERYDLKDDPDELDNRCQGAAADGCPKDAMQGALERRLKRLRHCAGVRGRDERTGKRPFCD